jgi:hypothetical protein
MASPHKAAAEGMAAGLPESPTAAVIYDLDIGDRRRLWVRCRTVAVRMSKQIRCWQPWPGHLKCRRLLQTTEQIRPQRRP